MWAPDEANLRTLAVLFQESVDGSRDVRTNARRQLETARQTPDLVNYLVYLLVEVPPRVPAEATDSVRATAGLWLKNILLFDWFKLPQEAVEYAKQTVTQGLGDKNMLVRNATSIVVTTLLSKLTLTNWPQVVPNLVTAIDNSAPGEPVQEGAVSALTKICEDSADLVGRDEALMAQLVPKLLTFSESPSAKVRSNAISCLTEFVPIGSQAFLVHIDEFLQACFNLAQTDSTPETMQSICKAFSELLTVRPDKLVPHLQGVVQFCLHCLKSDDENVALEGAEFLLAFAESDADTETLSPLLPVILPSILETMVFSEDDLFVLESVAEDDSQLADREEDIRPSLPKTKKGHGQRGAGGDDDSDDEDDDFESSLENWNLRKCSASTLDTLTQKEPHQTLEIVLPHLLQRINASQIWPVRESAVLAFGAIADGVQATGETGFVPELIPFLVDLLSNEHAPIREITCWTLSRYAEQQKIDWTVLQGVLQCTVDVNKRVQAAACAALSTLAENAGEQLNPYAADLFQHLRGCFAKYQANNMMALYECVQTVALAVTGAISESPAIIDSVMEPMLARWSMVSNEDRELLALLECLSFLAVATGPSFAKFAPPLFERSVLLVRESLVLLERAQLDPESVDAPEPMTVVCAVDMIDGLVQALHDEGMKPLFDAAERTTQTTLVEMLRMCLATQDLDIRQSALALVGDLAIFCFASQLQSHLPQLVPELISQVDPQQIQDDAFYEPVGDNAMWSIAEIAMHHSEFSLEPWFPDLFQRLGTVLCSPDTLSLSLLSNSATAIGRLGLGLPQLVAPHLSAFIRKWLEIIMDVDATLEKDTALQGICLSIAANPQGLDAEALQQFLKVLAAYFTPSPALKDIVGKVFEGYKSYLPNFSEIVLSLPPVFQQQLMTMYPVNLS